MNKTLGERFLHFIEKEKKLQSSTSATNLPSISLNQLEKEVHEIRKRKNFKENSDDSVILNSKELNVCSPFYDRMKTHKENCKCPYHRKKRFEVLPVRHSVKTGHSIKKSIERLQQSQSENRIHRLSNKETRKENKTKIINKSFDNIEEPNFTKTQNFVFKPKIETRNLTYEMFLKECEYHLLRRKGFSTGKPAHVVRKGLKEIFEFINNHLDYSVEKMTEWVNGVEKDKDYGEFYIERFREMKKNYESGLRKKKGKTFCDANDPNSDLSTFEKTLNSTGNNFKSKQALNSLYDANGRKYKSINNGSIESEEGYKGIDKKYEKKGWNENNEDDNEEESKKKMEEKYLSKIFDDIKEQNTISEEMSEDLMSLELKEFKNIFETLQKNIINNKYSDEFLLKLDSGVLNQLIRRSSTINLKDFENLNDEKNFKDPKYEQDNKNSKDSKDKKEIKDPNYSEDETDIKNISSPKSISNLQEKLEIIMKTQDIIRKKLSHKSSKTSETSEKTLLNATHTSKHYMGSKRNTGNTPNEEITKSKTGTHSKKSSNGDCSLVGSEENISASERDQKNGISLNKKYGFNQEENEYNEENMTEAERKRLKALGLLGPHIRRSKLLKPEDAFQFLRESFEYDNENDLEFRKQSIELHRGHFTKAEKYLFELNMGKTIIKNDDSIFTAKRKMRVIKLLLKETPNAPEADALRSYVKQTEQKIWLKTQKDKKLIEDNQISETEEIKEQDVWKSISLDNLGFELIFYNISSKFKIEDNEDLCILLNEWKLHNMRLLENQLSFKINLVTDDEERNSKKKVIDDILIQDGMRNMEFEPQMESDRDVNPLNQTKITTKKLGKTLMELNKLNKETKMNGFLSNNSLNGTLIDEDLEGLDEEQLSIYYKKIKEMFKYAKIHLPETFECYVKNKLTNYPEFSFEDSQFHSENFKF